MGQFKALAYKNWILYKRGLIGACCELFVPIITVVFVVLITRLITITEYQEKQYWRNANIGATYTIDPSNPNIKFNLKQCDATQIVALIPQSDPLISSLNTELTGLGYTTKFFGSDSQLNSYVRDDAYGKSANKICFGVTVQSSTPPNYKYKLRFNVSNDQGNTQAPSTDDLITSDKSLQLNLFYTIMFKGFVGINNLINSEILQLTSAADYIQNTIGPIYQQRYIDDPTYEAFGNSIQILVLLPLLVVYLRQVSSMLTQKQKKIRQTMSIMGMNTFLYYFTWFIRYFFIYLIIHLISSGILVSVFKYVNYGIFFTLFILFDIVLIIQAFFIQIFFSRSKIGVVFALVFFIIQYIISFVVTTSDNPTLNANLGASIVPHIAFILGFRTTIYAQSVQMGASFTQQINNYVIIIAVVSFLINIILYLILVWYLDQVFPNEWGSRKHPLFCCFGNRKIRPQIHENSSNEQMHQLTSEVQGVDQKFKDMEKRNQCVKIQELRKQFGEVTAVDNLNLTIYNDQIFALLGHNGAGKTTTISMLTGMLDPTSGYISILGENDVSTYRQYLGICPQHDTLYDDLTVYEHLYLFGTFKGLEGQQLEDQIRRLIADVNLMQKRDEYSSNLSGGQKRRLSVAMAFSGSSKVIILDQPTSGMDTSARRYIWQMLQSYKKDKIIILTTHFMDEADYLGDRIGIMGSGRLACCGSSLFLKNKYGVGYNITFVKKGNETPSTPIKNLVIKHISSAKVLSDVSSELSMQLPLHQVGKFEVLFNEIDAKKGELQYLTYGISITTLQEVFLKVSEEAHAAVEQKNKQKSSNNLQINNHGKDNLLDTESKLIKNNQSNVSKEEEIDFDQSVLVKQSGAIISFLRHFGATILKRLRVIRRDIKSFLFQLVLPVIIIVIALILMRISFITDFPEQELNINLLNNDNSPVQIGIAGSDATFLNNIEAKISNQYGTKINLFKDTSDLTDTNFDLNFLKMKKAQNKYFRGGLFFNPVSTNKYAFSSIINTRAIDTAIILPTLATQAIINNIGSTNYTISVVNAPLPRTAVQLSINKTISGFFASFIFALAFSFKFASIISFIVKERNDKAKHQQVVSGMNLGSYWLGNFVYDYFLYLILAVITCLLILAFDITGVIEQNGYIACWIIFVIFGLAYIPLTYIGGFLFTDYGSAQAAWYFITFVLSGLLPIITMLFRLISDSTIIVGHILAWIFRILPPFAFGQGLINLSNRTFYRARDNYDYKAFSLTIALAPIIFLVFGIFFYPLLLLIIQKLSNNQTFMRCWNRQSSIQDTTPATDSDVLEEQQKAQKVNPQDMALLTRHLRKVYRIDNNIGYKVAVDNLSVAIPQGQVFGLLGINGAGKSTTFKMLAGEITSTSGESYMIGFRIKDNLDIIRENLGYCPQFDALIQNLTVRQQIQLFYDLKSLPWRYKDQVVTKKIKEMDLEQYQDKLSGTLSGGNKRKLSVAMAMIGNPKIIFLDQPSTGMDPKARRFMWKIISRIATEKKQSTIILTTHSMQQAEALSTRLGIMVGGNFKCIGTPQHIKSKFGDGYEIQIKIIAPNRQLMKKLAEQTQLMNSKGQIKQKDLPKAIEKLKISPQISQLIVKQKSGGYLIKTGNISLVSLAEFNFFQGSALKIKQWMNSNIGQTQVLENYQTYVRYKTKARISIGKIFGLLQKVKKQMNIMQYSIKQASVEQIFNKFAQQQGVGMD